jgi:3-phenylpropionate/cinnamic acid dioxygenase small subunit
MNNAENLRIATELLIHEGRLLDQRDWSAWLALYAADAVYWVPAWRNEGEETADPEREVSLIYHPQRVGLEERVMRVRSRQSVTTLPLPRTTHFVTNVALVPCNGDAITAQASWMVQIYEPRTGLQRVHFGHCEVTLARVDQRWEITRKTIHLQNDCVAAVLDFYLL